jgi:dihydroorotate dehydrogenase (NAD+) catalytic subunit
VPRDLTVRLGPFELKSPVICGAGEHVLTYDAIVAALDAGAAAVVAKSTNESEAARQQLDAAEYALLDENWRELEWHHATRSATLLNRSGLVQAPLDEWLETLRRADTHAKSRGAYVVASLIPGDVDELPRLARAVEAAGLRWLELNVGAPHAGEAPAGAVGAATRADVLRDVVGSVRAATSLPLTVKLPGEGELVELARAAREAGADSVCLAGRVLGFLPDLRTRRPVLGTFGAVGGGWALPVTLRWIAKTRLALGADVPIVGTNGVRSGEDVARFLLAGATAVQLASAVMLEGPTAITRAVEQLQGYLDEHGRDARDLVGEAADAVQTYEEAAMRSHA